VVLLSNVRRFHEAHKGENRFLAEADRLFFRRSVAQEDLHVVPWAFEGSVKMGVFLVVTKTGERTSHKCCVLVRMMRIC